MDADTLPVGLQELAGFGRGLTQVKVIKYLYSLK